MQNFDRWERKMLILDPGFLTARRQGHFSMLDIRAAPCSRLSVSGDDQKSMQTTPSPSPLVPFALLLTVHAVILSVVPAGKSNIKPKEHGNSLFLAANKNKENAQCAPNPPFFR